MCSERPYDGRPCHMRIVWCNCDWYETYLLFNFEDAFQAWFDVISDERVAQPYNSASREWEVRCCQGSRWWAVSRGSLSR